MPKVKHGQGSESSNFGWGHVRHKYKNFNMRRSIQIEEFSMM